MINGINAINTGPQQDFFGGYALTELLSVQLMSAIDAAMSRYNS